MSDQQHPTWKVEIRETPNSTWFAIVRNVEGKLVFLTPAHATKADLLHSLDAFATWMYQIDGDWEHHFVEVLADAEPGNSGHEVCFVTKTCPACKCEASTVERRRRNTSYSDDTLNWTELCIDCFDADRDYWAERWDDHWRGRL